MAQVQEVAESVLVLSALEVSYIAATWYFGRDLYMLLLLRSLFFSCHPPSSEQNARPRPAEHAKRPSCVEVWPEVAQ